MKMQTDTVLLILIQKTDLTHCDLKSRQILTAYSGSKKQTWHIMT